MTAPHVIDNSLTFHDDPMTDKLGFLTTQHIPADFISQLKADRMDSARRPTGDFLHMCSIPVSVVEDLMAQGYNVYKEPIRETIKMLRLCGLDAFITSDKSL